MLALLHGVNKLFLAGGFANAGSLHHMTAVKLVTFGRFLPAPLFLS